MVIDERGCHIDLVLGDPTYVKDLNMSYRESNVFKFADKIGVRFLCEIKLCLKMDGGCEGITVTLFQHKIVQRNHFSLLYAKTMTTEASKTTDYQTTGN